MKYKFDISKTVSTLTSEFSEIVTFERNGHMDVTVRYNDGDYYKLKVSVLTNIHSRLNIFQKKVVLIHVYKLLDRFHTNASGLRQELKSTNYAAVFGSPWL